MSNDDRYKPPPQIPEYQDWFGPRVEKLAESLESIKERFGENSTEYATTLVKIGDAHMLQGSLSNPQALDAYEKALHIFRTQGEETPNTAWLYDKLANARQSSGDTAGAQADLVKAVDFWKKNADAPGPGIDERYVSRRQEDLERLINVNQFKNRKPPES